MSVPKKQRDYYSGKKKRHTQKAQVVADQISGRIIATAFSPGKKHDLALFRQSKAMMVPRINCLADSGYQGIDKVHPNSRTPKKKSKYHPLTQEQAAENRDLSQKRIGCEHIMGRLKVFRTLEGISHSLGAI